LWKGCEPLNTSKRENLINHLNSPFYRECDDYREVQRLGQIKKGADKYPEPFNPNSWSGEELLAHAMQENVDQAHYIYGTYKKLSDAKLMISDVLNNIESLTTEELVKKLEKIQNNL